MGVDKARQYDLAGAVDLVGFPRKLVFRDLVGRSDRGDLFAGNEHSAVFDDGELAQLRPATRTPIAAPQGQQLGGVGEKNCGVM
jgi:hypothetical protein